MNLIIFSRYDGAKEEALPGTGLLGFALSYEPLAAYMSGGLHTGFEWRKDRWRPCRSSVLHTAVAYDSESAVIDPKTIVAAKAEPWLVISQGRFPTQLNGALLERLLVRTRADLVYVQVAPELMGYREKVLLTPDGRVAGLRRFYDDGIEPVPMPRQWPHHVFIRNAAMEQLMGGGAASGGFESLLTLAQGLRQESVAVAGVVFDLNTERGLLGFFGTRAKEGLIVPQDYTLMEDGRCSGMPPGPGIARDCRWVGKVLIGRDVSIGSSARVIGPTILGHGVKVGEGAVVESSIVAQGQCIDPGQVIRHQVLTGRPKPSTGTGEKGRLAGFSDRPVPFRTWPAFSYARLVKRIGDAIAAVVVLALFLPFFPIFVAVIKASSKGPVFYRARRQGLHGREFHCLKFRTMTTGADQLQERLRAINDVDGPQFKMADDPRITAVGRFMRDTCLDEIPQFWNVLVGQMSIVGPRPSPKAENTLCPWWRDARLSVRPGITGLWQVERTRQSGKDFQEWIQYDVEYVKALSLRRDLWICWKTVVHMVRKFIEQF